MITWFNYINIYIHTHYYIYTHTHTTYTHTRVQDELGLQNITPYVCMLPHLNAAPRYKFFWAISFHQSYLNFDVNTIFTLNKIKYDFFFQTHESIYPQRSQDLKSCWEYISLYLISSLWTLNPNIAFVGKYYYKIVRYYDGI